MTTTLEAAADIRRSTGRFIDETSAMSTAQWLRTPPTGGWSASEVMEHVTLANRGIGSVLRKSLTALDAPTAMADDEIPYLFYRGDEPPNVAPPTGTATELGAAIDGFRSSADAVVDWTGAAELDLRASGARIRSSD
jgi:hypothetical protein